MGSDFSSSLWFLVLQWAYALWQAVRNTKGFNLIFYTLQWLGFQCLTTQENRDKTVVWVNKEHHGDLFEESWENFRTCVLHKNIEDMNMEFLEFKDYWYQVKYRGKHYWVHQDVFFELYMYKLRDYVFVKDLYYLDVKYAVAQKISEEEAMLLMFNKDMHLFPLKTKHVIYGQEINIEYNSKLSGFLSTIPLIMQARGLTGMSAWASLILLLIDLFRTPMYRLYDTCFFHLVKFFKLRVFMQTTWLYTFFGLFSDRWRYSDFTKGYAYLTHEGQEIEVTTFVSSSAKDDCTLSTLRQYKGKSPDMQHFCIRDGVITSGGFNYGEYSAIFKVKKGMFVT